MDDMEMWWSLIALLIAVALVGCPGGADGADDPPHTDTSIHHASP